MMCKYVMGIIADLWTLTDRLTYLCRADGLPCPPVPPQRFQLRYIFFRLHEIERALNRDHVRVLPARAHGSLPARLYDRCRRICWAVCGEPPACPETHLVGAALLLRTTIKALESASAACRAARE